jgi:hypothetical protein
MEQQALLSVFQLTERVALLRLDGTSGAVVYGTLTATDGLGIALAEATIRPTNHRYAQRIGPAFIPWSAVLAVQSGADEPKEEQGQ